MAFSEGSRFLGTRKSDFMDQLPNIKDYMTFGRLYLLLWVAGTCLLRNLYADQEATVRTRHGEKTAS